MKRTSQPRTSKRQTRSRAPAPIDRRRPDSFSSRLALRHPMATASIPSVSSDVVGQKNERSDAALTASVDRLRHRYRAMRPDKGLSLRVTIQVNPDRCTRQSLEVFVKDAIRETHGDDAARSFDHIEVILYEGEEMPT